MNRSHSIDPQDIIVRCLKASEAKALELPEIQSALAFIARHIDRELTVKQVADEQRISRRTLELRFRTHLKCTVGNMLTRLRVAAACQLLEETELSAGDISVDVGFASASSMSNALRRHLGKTATEIRSKPASSQQASRSRQAPDCDAADEFVRVLTQPGSPARRQKSQNTGTGAPDKKPSRTLQQCDTSSAKSSAVGACSSL